ncbi:supervillin-like isoform X2 [Polyodon spathula]|uniref:supervillin-like isoform X2 n=1 Tax=Polyodon spathula TaxID=7913 RepID=UPI001B7F23F8|nr:supervillin-like isoform X2 [Polyodon spathula]
MFRNRWISNYVGAIKYCGEGFESEASIRFENSRLLQRRALSFQKELSFEDKEQLCKSTQDIDANILAVLPKVSELRKRFEPESHTALEMNRKERIARRLEAIESDTQLQSCPGLVSHRLLEEDTPRYTRANDPCSPCAARRFSKEELNIQESEDPSSERQSRARCRAEPQSIHTESTYSTGSMETAGTDSKAERIARYKAERRRQLAERYGISLDHELESDFSPKYPRMRKEPEALAQHAQASQNRKEQEEQDRELSSLYSTRTGFVREPKIMQSKENAFRESVDCFSDQERMMNLENYKRAQDPGAQTGVYGKPLFMDVSTTTTVPGKDFSAGEVPGSPRHGRQSSLQSPQQSPGDLFIEHQAQNILSRQGLVVKPKSEWFLQKDSEGETPCLINWPSRIKVRERMVKAEGIRGSPELVTETTVSRRHPRVPPHDMPFQSETSAFDRVTAVHMGVVRKPVYGFVQPAGPVQSARSVTVGEKRDSCSQSNLQMPVASSSGAKVRGLSADESEKWSEGDQSFGNLLEEKHPVRTECLLKSRKAVLPSEILKREKNQDDPCRVLEEEQPSVASPVGHRPSLTFEDLPRVVETSKQQTQTKDSMERSEAILYFQRGSALAPAKQKGPGQDASTTKHKMLTRSMSDFGVAQKVSVFRNLELAPKRETFHSPEASRVQNGELCSVDTRVSVSQLIHSYLETAASCKKQELEAEVELTTTGLDSASKTERERGARRPRRYISPGENRKTSERFRTQPITSSERLESDRSHLSPENNEADEEKLDERAKMSVAAKRSLFRELEKSIDSAPVPKPRSRNAAVERRLRRTQDRSRTQPVTTEEVVIAATVPAPASQTVTVHTTVARIPSPTVVSTSVQRISLQASSQQKALAREQAREGATEEQGPEEPDLSTLSLSEKMALFNRLSQTSTKVASRSRADLRQRRVNTRYQTQPITLGEVEQLQNGARGKIGPLSPSIVKSVAAAASQAATLSTTSAGELQLGRSKAVREESLSSTQRLYNRSIPKHHSTAASADPSVKSVAAPELKPLHLTTEKQQQQQPEITGVFQSYSVAEQRPAELRGAVAQESSSKVKHRSTEWGGKQKQQQQQPPAQPSGSERDAEIRELRHDAARRSSRELPTEPQGFLRSESAAVLERQEARGVLRERQPLQDPFESESVQKSKTVVSELLEPTASLRAVSATARSASRTSNVLPSILQPSELTEDRGYGVQSELISAKENQAETSEELPDSMSSRQMSIKDRLALLKKSGEEDWRNRINKKQDAVKVVVSEHQSQLWEVKQSFKKKVTGPGAEKKENNHPENYT